MGVSHRPGCLYSMLTVHVVDRLHTSPAGYVPYASATLKRHRCEPGDPGPSKTQDGHMPKI